MSDEEKQGASEQKVDVRESPAFKGVVKQLDEARRQASELAAQVQLLNDTRSRQELESKGQYEQALATVESGWKSKLAEREAELASIKAAHEVASVELSLASVGVHGRARTYLAKDYAALGPERPEFSKWIESVKSDPEFSAFFSVPQAAEQVRQARPGDGAGRAAGGTKAEVDWAQVRADIINHDPKKSGPAIRQMSEYIRSHGAAPPKEQ